MEPLHEFIVDLEEFIKTKGYEITSSMDIDLIARGSGQLIGYWPSTINHESFREIK
jgi:hypothetical protein